MQGKTGIHCKNKAPFDSDILPRESQGESREV